MNQSALALELDAPREGGAPAFTCTVHGTPQPAGSKKVVPMGGRYGVIDANKKSRPWKDQVAQHAGLAMNHRPVYLGPLELVLRFYVVRPKGHYGASGVVRPSAPKHPAVRPDVLKLARAVEDALSGVVYRDDSQIVIERLEKHYGSERVEIEVREL